MSIQFDNVAALEPQDDIAIDVDNLQIGDDVTGEPAVGVNSFFDEFKRLRSFPNVWVSFYPKVDLSRNGFHLVRDDFWCKCTFCQVELDAGTAGEPLEDRHKVMSPNCDFAHGRPTENIALGDVGNYRLEKHRLVSFLRTNWTAPVDPYDLAKWGFYWTGSADVGRCAFCRLEVRGWERGDGGFSEHSRWNPQCAFLRGQEVGNVPLGEEGNMGTLQTDSGSSQQIEDYVNVNFVGDGPRPSARQLGIEVKTPAKHVEYSSLAARINSFEMWPLSIKQRPQELAEAGFFYCGRGDRTICFQCGGGLKDWGPTDDPWVEHAAWFSTCVFLINKKGVDFIIKVEAVKNKNQSDMTMNLSLQSTVNRNNAPPMMQQVAVDAIGFEESQEVSANNQPEMETQEPETGEGESGENFNDGGKFCRVCRQKDLGVVFLPCGHMATCTECATQKSNCPICHKKIGAYIRAFLP